ncbi:MAG: ATP synthase F1 subunit delta [Defluviitaleaceae bacterium]|nr:ATP synthase F1 subunit delta [Defluviitaleaceae bacterium]
MVKNNEVYAWQLFIDGAKTNQVELIRDELKNIIEVLKAQPRFNDILNMPTMTIQQKKQLIEESFSGDISATVIHFLTTLVEEEGFDRLESVERIYDETVRQYLDDHLNIIEGVVYSVHPLKTHQLERLVAAFSQKTGKQVRFKEVVDASLIGGYKVELESQVYDDTIATQLEALRASIKKVDLE